MEKNPEWSLRRLPSEGFDPNVIEAVDAMTRRPKESYDGFVLRAWPFAPAREPFSAIRLSLHAGGNSNQRCVVYVRWLADDQEGFLICPSKKVLLTRLLARTSRRK
jgi:hypothetical protein